MKKILFFLGCLSLMTVELQTVKIYLLSNHDNVGDHNQTLGIRAAFDEISQEENGVEDINTKESDALEIKTKVEKDLAREKVIVIGAGEGGIDGVAALTKNPNLTVCLTSHMVLDRYSDPHLLGKIDFVALPTHVAPSVKQALGSKLIETTGVAHNRRLDMAIYNEWKNELPAADTYLVVYLGGDAPTPTKEMKLFTKEDASHLADYTVTKVKEMSAQGAKVGILVLNGPRTGKHDMDKKEDPTVHRAGKADPITDFFAQKLTENHMTFKTFDFQHDTLENKKWVSPYNAFDLAIGAVKETQGQILIPGESTSVVSEVRSIFPTGHVIVYTHGAMNEVHMAHVVSEPLPVLEDYKTLKKPEPQQEEMPSATEVIATRLWKAANAS